MPMSSKHSRGLIRHVREMPPAERNTGILPTGSILPADLAEMPEASPISSKNCSGTVEVQATGGEEEPSEGRISKRSCTLRCVRRR